jgi:hypothetical protein
MIGISIRLALALGLHLRNEDPTTAESRKEMLAHTWWALHSIECLVSTITGRPPVIALEDCTVSLPRSLRGERSNSQASSRPSSRRKPNYVSPQPSGRSKTSDSGMRSSGLDNYLTGHISNTLISQKALLKLYSPRTAVQSWEVCIPMWFRNEATFQAHVCTTGHSPGLEISYANMANL